MSKEIDNQVVQMTFDNKQFEKNAAQTISTIDKLKMSLQFKGVSEGLKEVSKAIASFPVKSIGNAADVVTNKFSLMGTAVDQLIRNTERRLEAFATNAVNTLNIFKGGLTAGFSEYETQINAVQTIWANTRDAGTQMGDITRVLDELNEYADKTIYNFSEMTRNIGTFTAAGVGLEESATAIQGIANLAAVSGSTSQQAATAMYQLSQALSAGKVNLMDWNSVVNAGMGGKMFRDVLAETAEELGTINSQFAKGLKDGSINFRETLTKEGWITSEVLTAALTKFTDTSTELGRMATDAATKVKTFTQLISTLKESVQSGWTQSWEYIIGDFESARNLFTELSNKIQSLIQPSMDARNKMLAYWSGANKANEEAEKNLKAQEKHQNEIEALAKRVIANEFGVGQARYDALDALGYDHREVQNAVQHMLGLADAFVIEAEAAEESDKSTKKSFDQMSGREHVLAGLVNIGNALGEVLHFVKLAFTDVFPPITGAKLVYISQKFHEFTETLDLNRDQLNQIRNVFKGFFSIFKIGFKIISSTLSGVLDAFSKILPSGNNVLSFLENVGNAISNFSINLDEDGIAEAVSSFTDSLLKFLNLEKIKPFFTSVLPKIASGISTFFSNVWTIFSNLAHLKITDAIANTINLVSNTLRKIFGAISGLDITIKEGALFNSEGPTVFEAIAERIGSIFSSGKQLLGNDVPGKIQEITKEGSILGDIISAIKNKAKQLFDEINLETITDIINSIVKVFNAINFGQLSSGFKNISKSLGKTIETFRQFRVIIDPFGGIGTSISGSISSIGASFVTVSNSIKDSLKSLETTIKAKALKDIAIAVLMLTGAIVMLGFMKMDQVTVGLLSIEIMIGTLYSIIKGFDNMSIDINVATSLIAIGAAISTFTLSLLVLSIIPWQKLLIGAAVLIGMLFSIAGISKIFAKSGDDILSLSAGILVMSFALNSLIVPMLAFSLMNPIKIAAGMATVFGALLIFGGISKILKKSIDDIVALSAVLMLFATSLSFLIPSILVFSLIPTELITNALISIAKILVIFASFSIIASLVKSSDIAIASLALLAFSVALTTMIPALLALSILPLGSVLNSILVMSALLLSFVGVSVLIKSIKATTLISVAASIISFALALSIIIPLIVVLSTIPTEGINNAAKALFAIIGAFSALMVILAVVNYFASGTLPLIIASIAALALSIGVLIFSIGSVINAVSNLINSIILLGTSDMSSFGDNFSEVCDGIIDNAEKLKTVFVSVGSALIGAFMTLLPEFQDMLSEFFWSIATVFGEVILPIGNYILPKIWQFLLSLFVDGLRFVGDNADEVIAALAYAINNIANAIENEGGALQDAFLHLFDAIIKFIMDWQTKLKEKAWEIITIISNKIEEGKDLVKEKAKEVFQKILNVFTEGVEDVKQAGKDFITGLANGILENAQEAISAASGLGSKLLKGLKDSLDEHSPSKATELIGKFFDEGFGIGVEKGSGGVLDKIKTFGSNVLGTFENSIENSGIKNKLSSLSESFNLDDVTNSLGDNLSLETTITPIMDLSNVSSGISDINSMFGSQSLQLSDLNSSLTSSLDVGQLQNGSYDDAKIVASISNLDARMDALASAISSIQIRMDTGALVGSIAGPMDSALGKRAVYAGRGIR